MKVNAQLSAARRFAFEEAGELFGFSIPLRNLSDTAELRVEVVKDQGDRPGREVIASADLAFPAATSLHSPWTDILFPSSTRVDQGTGMWLVVKAKKGAMEWIGSSEAGSDFTTTLYNSEGGLWQSYPSVSGNRPVAQIRVLRSPFMKENEPLLSIVWNWKVSGKIEQSIEVTEDPARIEFELTPAECQQTLPEGGTVSVPLTVTARSSGILTIKGAVAFRRS